MDFSGGLFPRLVNVPKGTVCNDPRSLQNPAGGLGGAVSPSVSRAEPWWGPGGKAPRSSKDSKVYITKKRLKLTLVVHV